MINYSDFEKIDIRVGTIIEAKIKVPETTAICSIEKPISIRKPNKGVPNAVENTINAVVKAFIDPIYLTP